MKFNYYDMGSLNRGDVVEVTLRGDAANVRLMDSMNFSAYKNGHAHRYQGGLITRSPVHLTVSHSGHWYVTVDMQGLRGRTQSSVRVLPKPLPPLRPLREPSLASMSSLVRELPPNSESSPTEVKQYDVFVSHASEDKEEIVRPLVDALKQHELTVWFDEHELKIGDSLRRKIDQGVANSRFGIVVLSQAFFNKGWPNYELDGLVTRSNNREQAILPIWHKVSKEEVISYSASLADKLARNTSTSTVSDIAAEIADVIQAK